MIKNALVLCTLRDLPCLIISILVLAIKKILFVVRSGSQKSLQPELVCRFLCLSSCFASSSVSCNSCRVFESGPLHACGCASTW
jgi:hypothetical protein